MKTKEPGLNTKTMIILLAALGVAIIILVIVIILLSRGKGEKYPNLSADNLAKECLEQYDKWEVIECLEEKASSYSDDCEEGLKVYSDMPIDWFEDEYQLSDFYSIAYSESLSCDNKDLQDYWRAKNDTLLEKLGARD